MSTEWEEPTGRRSAAVREISSIHRAHTTAATARTHTHRHRHFHSISSIVHSMLVTSRRLARSAVAVGTAGRSDAAPRAARRFALHRPLSPHSTVTAPFHSAQPSIQTSVRASWRSPSSSSTAALTGAALASLSLLLLGPSLAHAAAADPAAAAAADDQDPARRHTRLPAARLSVETLSRDYKDVPLTLLERARVRDLRDWLQREVMAASDPAGAEERAYLERWALHDDWALLRYLRAHKHSVAAAGAGLLATVRWRIAERVDDIRVDEFADEYRAGNMYVSTECDPVGRSIVVNRKNTDDNPAHKWDHNAYQHEMRSLVYTLERAIRTMEDRVTSGEIDPTKIDYKVTPTTHALT